MNQIFAQLFYEMEKHRDTVLFHLIKQLCKDLIHSFSLFHCRIRLRRR